jgi:hypothetical protein
MTRRLIGVPRSLCRDARLDSDLGLLQSLQSFMVKSF